MAKPKTVITKLDILRSPKGHTTHFSGTGIHISRKIKPKGNRGMLVAKAIREW